MNRIYIVLLLFFVHNASAQDFTHTTKNVAFAAGELSGNLERCLAHPEIQAAYRKSIETLKKTTFPDRSYQPYIELFNESFVNGKKKALDNPTVQEKSCDKYHKDADLIIKHYEQNKPTRD